MFILYTIYLILYIKYKLIKCKFYHKYLHNL